MIRSHGRRVLGALVTLAGVLAGASEGLCATSTSSFALSAGFSPGPYPEYQVFVKQHSGRPVNCALCHTHSDGPDGGAYGQLGSLDERQLGLLARARSAFEPGQDVESPILNGFGNRMLRELGRNRILELRARPQDLPQALGFEVDLDGDGISDAQEYLDGTHPLHEHDGHAWLLFVHNFRSNWFHIAMIGVATALTMFGLAHLLRGYGVEVARAHPDQIPPP